MVNLTRTLALVPLLVLVAAGCSASPSSVGSSGETEDQLIAGKHLTMTQIAGLLQDAGFDDSVVPQMVCVAKWESSFYAGAQHTNGNGSTDLGLFQINDHFWKGPCHATTSQLLNETTNTACAKKVFDTQGVRAWAAYKAHKKECDAFVVPGFDPGAGSAPMDPAAPTGPSTSPAPDPSASGSGGDGSGSCFSATLQTRVAEGECVQSAKDSEWYQCSGGQWFRGLTDDSGVAGKCVADHPLDGF